MSYTVTVKKIDSGLAGSSISFSPNTNCSSNNTLILFITFDNSRTGGIDPFSEILDSKSNTWSIRNSIVQSPGGSESDGVVLYICTTNQNNGPLLSSDSITLNFSTDINNSALILYELSSTFPLLYSDNGINSQTNDLYPTITTNTLNSNDIIFAASVGNENNVRNYDTDTTNGSWINGGSDGKSLPPDIQIISQYKIVSGNGAQTYNPTFTNTGMDPGIEIASGWISFYEQQPTGKIYILNTNMTI